MVPRMKHEAVVAIAGATGLVGSEIIGVFEDFHFPYRELRLLASEESVGELYEIDDETVAVELLEESAFNGVDIVIFAVSSELAAQLIPKAIDAGAVVIDTSAAFRLQSSVPLIVPEVNLSSLGMQQQIVACPGASTVQLAPLLKVVRDLAGIERIVVSTYQSVSGAGKHALDELWAQTVAICNQREVPVEVFQHQIAFNCVPQIDVVTETGYTREEVQVVEELRRVLGMSELRASVTAVRVPVFHCHAQSVNIEMSRDLQPERLAAVLHELPGFEVYSGPEEFPLPSLIASTDEVHVSRIRRDVSVPHGLDLWVAADNLRRGAALTAVQIAKYMIERVRSE